MNRDHGLSGQPKLEPIGNVAPDPFLNPFYWREQRNPEMVMAYETGVLPVFLTSEPDGSSGST